MIKTILSWDVGIKNLAYCMIEKNEEINDFKIKHWGVINLVDDRQECDYIMTNKNKCEKNAVSSISNKDDLVVDILNEKKCVYCCNSHKKKMTPVLEEIKYKPKDKIKIKCNECNENAKYRIEKMGLNWCEKHNDKNKINLIKKIKIKKITLVTCSKQPIQNLAEKLFSRLDNELTNLLSVDEVLIENQPSLINPTMKTISSLLYSYFIIRGITDKNKTKSNITLVKFVSPSNKLRVNEINTNKILDKKDNTKEKVYGLTKRLGEKYCKALITIDDCNLLEKVKKKDDMCDAFLQGFRYLFPIVPKKHFDKIEKIGFDETKKRKVKIVKVDKTVNAVKDDKDLKDDKTVNAVKDLKDDKDLKDVKTVNAVKDVKDDKDVKDLKDDKTVKDVKDVKVKKTK